MLFAEIKGPGSRGPASVPRAAGASAASGTTRRVLSARWLTAGAALFVAGCLLALPILGTRAYFRHDDAQILLWATTFRGSIAQVFSFDPAVNLWGTGRFAGMDGYYRPVAYTIVLVLVRTFGIRAPILLGLSGAAAALSLVAYAVSARMLAGSRAAILSLVVFLVAYGQVLYQTFRLTVPYMYLLEFGSLALLLAATRRRSWPLWTLGAAVFVGACLARQSSIVLVPSIVISAELFAEKDAGDASPQGRGSRWRVSPMPLLLAAISAAVLLVGFAGPGAAAASSLSPAWVAVRAAFYAEATFGGVRSAIAIAPVLWLAAWWGLKPRGRGRSARRFLAALAVAIAAAVLISAAPVWGLAVVMLVLVAVAVGHPAMRVATIWFLVGFWFYTIPEFYHQAYLLEALLGLALLSSQCWGSLAREAKSELGDSAARLAQKWRGFGRWVAIAVAVLLVAGIVLARPLPRIAAAAQAVTAFDAANASTSRLVDGIVREAPRSSVVMMFSNEQREASAEKWRNESLAYRASQVRVLDNPDLQAMVGALGRTDVVVEEYSAPAGRKAGAGPLLGAVYSPQERAEVERDWRVERAADFSVGNSRAQLLWLGSR